MEKKLPETNVPESESPAIEKKKSDLSGTSDENADESGETGAEATPESPVGTSEDPEPVESQEPVRVTRNQKKGKGSKKQVEGYEGDSKLERSVSRSPDKASRTRSRKKSTSEKETDVSKESDQKTALEGSPPQPSVSAKGANTPLKAENVTPPKSKSPSILMRLRSHSKLRTERSASVPPDDGSTKLDELRGKAKLEKSSDISSPAKRRGLVRKAKSVSRERSKSTTSQSESMDTAEAEPDLKETDEKGSKPKSKASAKSKLPSTKQEKAEADSTTVEESQQSPMIKSLATTCEQVSSGIQSIQLSKKANEAASLLCLDESIDSTSSGASGKEEIGTGEATKVEIKAGGSAGSDWKPQQSQQEGGFQKDVIWAQFSTSIEDPETEVSVVSGSSAIKLVDELEKGLSTSTDTLSEIPGLEEASGGQESEEKSPPQGQKRVKGKESLGSDEDYKAVSCSPVKKVATERKPAESEE